MKLFRNGNVKMPMLILVCSATAEVTEIFCLFFFNVPSIACMLKIPAVLLPFET